MVGEGTLLNAATVTAGSLVGLALGRRLPARVQETVVQALGALTLLLGVQMGLAARDAPLAVATLASLVAGAAVGEGLALHDRFEAFARRLEARLAGPGGTGRIAQGFLAASLLFCVGPMTLLGAIQDGLGQPPVLLYTKAALDGVASVGLAAGLGPGVLLSVVTVLVYQGGLTALAALTRLALGELPVTVMTAAGGVMVIGIGLSLLGIARPRTLSLVPALVLAPVAELLARRLAG